ncbi:hypothetical protein R1flu_006648 [Riccia fluitans]|uniref:START domain-containing protein n=1 Tax=Riccia fluitans TaxID=41844 RepID=A0ABD1YZA8_9MARC
MELKSSAEGSWKWHGSVTAAIASPIERTWETASDFSGLHKFVPIIEICERLKGRDRVPGCVRFYTLYSPSGLPGGRRKGWAKERLLDIDERGHSYTYVVEGSNMNLGDCVVTFKASPSKREDGETETRVDWSYALSPMRKSMKEKIICDMSEFGWTFIKGLEAATKEDFLDFEGCETYLLSSGSSDSSKSDEFDLKNLILSRHPERVSMDMNLSKPITSGRGQQDDDDVASSSDSSSMNFPETRRNQTRKTTQDSRGGRGSGTIPRANIREQEDDESERRDLVSTSQGPYHALQLAANRLTGDVQDDIARQLESVEEQLEAVGLQMQEAITSGFKDGTFRTHLRSSDVEPAQLQPLPVTTPPPALVSRKVSPSIQKLRDAGSQTSAIGMRYSTHVDDSQYTDHVVNSKKWFPGGNDQGRSLHPLGSTKSGGMREYRTAAGSSSALHTETRSDYGSNATKEDGMDPDGDSGDSTPSSTMTYEARGCQTCRCQSCRVPSDTVQTVRILGKVGSPQPGTHEFVTMQIKNGQIPKSLGLIEICRDFQAQEGQYEHTWKEASVLQQFEVERYSYETGISPSKDKELQLHVNNDSDKAEPGRNPEADFHAIDTGKWKNAVLRSKFLRETLSRSYDKNGEYPANKSSPAFYGSERDMRSEENASSRNYDPEGIVRQVIPSVTDKKFELSTGDNIDYSLGVERGVDKGAACKGNRSSQKKQKLMEMPETPSFQSQRKSSRPSHENEVQSVQNLQVEAVRFQEDHIPPGPHSSQVKEGRGSKSNLNPKSQSGYVSEKWNSLTQSNPSDHATEDRDNSSNSWPNEKKLSHMENGELESVDGSREVEVNTRPPLDRRAPSVAAHSSYEFVRSTGGLFPPCLPSEAPERASSDIFHEENKADTRVWSLDKHTKREKKNETSHRQVAQSRLCIDIRQEYEPGDDVSHQEVQSRMQDEIAKEFALLGLGRKRRRSKKSNRSKSESDLLAARDFPHDDNTAIHPEIYELEEGCGSLDNVDCEDSRFKDCKELLTDRIPAQLCDIPQDDSASRTIADMRAGNVAQSLNDGWSNTRRPPSVAEKLAAVGVSKRRSKSAPRYQEDELVEPTLAGGNANSSARHVSRRRPTPYPIPLSQEARLRKEEILNQLQSPEVLEDFPAQEPDEVMQESDQAEWITKNGESSLIVASGYDDYPGPVKTKKSDAIVQNLNRKSSRSGDRRKSRQASAEQIVSRIPRDRSIIVLPKSELTGLVSHQDSISQMEMNVNVVPGNRGIQTLGSLKPLSSHPYHSCDILGGNSRCGHFEDQEPPGRHPTMVAQNWNNPEISNDVDDTKDRNGQTISKKNLKTLGSKNSQKYLAKMLTRLSQKIAVLQSQGLIEIETPPYTDGFVLQKVSPSESLDPREKHGSAGSSAQAQGTMELEPRQQSDHIHLRKSQDLTNLMRRRSSEWPFPNALRIETKSSISPSLVENLSDVQQITEMPEISAKWSHQISRASMMTNNLDLLALERVCNWDRMRNAYEKQKEWQPATPHSQRLRDLKGTNEPKETLLAERDVGSQVQQSFNDTHLRSTHHQTVLTENWISVHRPSIHTQTSDEMSDARQGRDGQGQDSSHLNTSLSPEAPFLLRCQRSEDSGSLRRQSIHTQTSDGISTEGQRLIVDKQPLDARTSTSEWSSSHRPQMTENWGSVKRQSIHTQTIDGLNTRDPHDRQVQVLSRPSIHHHTSSSSEALSDLRTRGTGNWGPRRTSESVQTQTSDRERDLQLEREHLDMVSGESIHHITSYTSRGNQYSPNWEEPPWDRSLEKWNPAASKEGQLKKDVQANQWPQGHKRAGELLQRDELRGLPFSQYPHPLRTDSMETHVGDVAFRGNQQLQHAVPQQQVEPLYRYGQQDSWFHQSMATTGHQYPEGSDFQHVAKQELLQNHVPQNQMVQQSQLQDRVQMTSHLSQQNQTMDNMRPLHGSMGRMDGMNFRNPQHIQDDRRSSLVAQPRNMDAVVENHRNERLYSYGISPGPLDAGSLAVSGRLYDQGLQSEAITSVTQHSSQVGGGYNNTRLQTKDLEISNPQDPQIRGTYAVAGISGTTQYHPSQRETVYPHSNIEFERMHSFVVQPEALNAGMHRSLDTKKMYDYAVNSETLDANNHHPPNIERMHSSAGQPHTLDDTPRRSDVDRIPSFRMQPQTFNDSNQSSAHMDMLQRNFSMQPHAIDDSIDGMHRTDFDRMHSFAVHPQALNDAIRRASNLARMQNSAVQLPVSDAGGDQTHEKRISRKNQERVSQEQGFAIHPDEMDPVSRRPSERMGSSSQATTSYSLHPTRKEPTPRFEEQVKSSGSKHSNFFKTERMQSVSVQPQVTTSVSRLSSQKQVLQNRPPYPSVVQVPQKAAKDFKALQKDMHGAAHKKNNSDHRPMDDIPPEVLRLGSKNPRKSSQMQMLNDLLQDLEATVSRSRQNSRDRMKSNLVGHELNPLEGNNDKRLSKHVKFQARKGGQTSQDGRSGESFDGESSEHLETEAFESHDDAPEKFHHDSPESKFSFHKENFDREHLHPHPVDEVDGDHEAFHQFENDLKAASRSPPFEDEILDKDEDEQPDKNQDIHLEGHEGELTDHDINTDSLHLPEGHDNLSYNRSTCTVSQSLGGTRGFKDHRDPYSLGTQLYARSGVKDMNRVSSLESQTKGEMRKSSLKSVVKDEPRKPNVRNPTSRSVEPKQSKLKSTVKQESRSSKSSSRIQMRDGRGMSRVKTQMDSQSQGNHSLSQSQLHHIPEHSEETEPELATTPQELGTLVESEGGSAEEELTSLETEGDSALLPYEAEGEERSPLETQDDERSSIESRGEVFTPRETQHDSDPREPPRAANRRVASRVLDEKDPLLRAKSK